MISLRGATTRVALTLLLIVGLGAGPADAAPRTCPNVRGAEVIVATGVSCQTAHKIARRWVAGFREDRETDRRVLAFRCRNRPNEVEGDTIFCTQGRRVVRFYPNVPLDRRQAEPAELLSLAEYLEVEDGCIDAYLSEVDPPAQWAAVTLTNALDCPIGDGVAVYRRSTPDAGWRMIYQGPLDLQPCSLDRPPRVPEPVAVDLKLCRPGDPAVVVPTYTSAGLQDRPRRLGVGSRGEMLRARWSRWTQREGRGRAIFDYADRDNPFRVPVRLRFYRRATCDGTRVFTRLRVTAVRPRDRRRIAFLSVIRNYTSCEQLGRG